MLVREAREDDIASLTDLGYSLLEHHQRLAPEWIVPAGDAEWFAGSWGEYVRYFVTGSDSLVLLAEDGPGAVKGYLVAVLRERPPIIAGPPDLLICEIAVDPQLRSQGLGARLLRHANAWGREHGAMFSRLHVYERNARAISFYEREGYASHERVLLRRLDDPAPEA